jgi:hypothetical protein
VPYEQYQYLELGAIASQRGNRPASVRLVQRAAELNPHDELTADTLRAVKGGEIVTPKQINESLAGRARRLAR